MLLLDLPQELIDHIIDEFAGDAPSLTSASLVCRRFYPTSRRQLFASIHLHPGRYVQRVNFGNLYPAFFSLLEHAPHIAPLVSTLHVTELAGFRRADETNLFTEIATALDNVAELIVDSNDDNGMPWHYVPNERVVGLRHLVIGSTLRSLAFIRVRLDWSFVGVISQCSSLKELRFEDSTIDDGVYPAIRLSSRDTPRSQLSTLILRLNADGFRHALLWDEASFEEFIYGLIAGDWADAKHLRLVDFSEFASSDMHHSAMQDLLNHTIQLEEFIWRRQQRDQLFDIQHVPKITIIDI